MKAPRAGIFAAVGVVLAVTPAAAGAREATVPSFDGTPIATHFFPAPGLEGGTRAPTVLLAHGWGGAGETNPEAGSDESGGGPGPAEFLKAGYNVLTWDARGFGDSGGESHFDSPGWEGRDVQALIGHVARQPEAQLDGAGDPTVGMAGASYGGAIQLVTAAIDRRVDAITPVATWNSLERSLYRARSSKMAWNLVLGGLSATGSVEPSLREIFVTGTTTGDFSQAQLDYLRARGITPLAPRIRVPTLLQQGTVDTLFTLREAMDTFELLKGSGVPLKMMWFCGGHGACPGESGPPGRLATARLRWFDRWLKRDPAVDTGPTFEWLADTDGQWRSAEMFPPAERQGLRATGSGSLTVSTASWSEGSTTGAEPARGAFELDLPAVTDTLDAVGEPRLELTYRGTAQRADTHLYAQLVDMRVNRVVGKQVAPVPVTLDGQVRQATVPLEPVAVRLTPGARLRLQVAAGTNGYYFQRSGGTVELASVSVELPTVDAARRPVLRLGRPRGLRRARRGRPARVWVGAELESYRDAGVRLYRRTGRRWRGVGGSRRFDVGTAGREVRISVRRRLSRGRYLAHATATDAYGRPVEVRRETRLR